MKILGILMILLGFGITIWESYPLIKSGSKLSEFIGLDPLLIGFLAVPFITNAIIGISIIKKLKEKYIHIMFFVMYICMTFSWGIKTISFFIPFHIIFTLMKQKKGRK